jgi:acetyltransferase-like isoleucine patch superfamily enzyme
MGSEFRVNTWPYRRQEYPSVAMDEEGNFVITWDSMYQDGSLCGVYAQLFDSSGNPVGSEFKVNTQTYHDQKGPSVAMDADGDFVITWQTHSDGSGWGVKAQLFESSGIPVGSEFLVNTYTYHEQRNPSVAMDEDGDFVITWQSYMQDSSENGVYAQRFDSSGNPMGSEFQVNTYTPSSQSGPSVAMDKDGDFVITWNSYLQDGSGSGVYAQRFDSSGNPVGSEFRVNTYILGGQADPSVAMDADGSFVITWHSSWQDGHCSGVYAQCFDSSGNPVGNEFQVNTYTIWYQWIPSVSMDEDGDFVITWESSWQDGDKGGVYAQRFVYVQPPVSDAGPDQAVFVGETVTFDGTGSYDPDGTIESYYWDFGDSGTDDGENTVHIYETAGVYTVTLTVTDDNDLSSSDTLIVSVIPDSVSMGENVQLGQGVSIGEDVVLGDDVIIGDWAVINENVNIGDGTQIGSNVVIGEDVKIGEEDTIGDGCTIGEGTVIKNGAEIGSNVIIGLNVKIGKYSIIGDDSLIGDNVQIGNNEEIPAGSTIP